ncbi:MAG: hypothetical protein ACRDP1_07035 [Nocardioidaceae bacterium]
MDPAPKDRTPDLLARPCLALCSWSRTEEEREGLPVFRCGGCGTEWVRSQGWTPIDHTGVVPDAVAAEVQ